MRSDGVLLAAFSMPTETKNISRRTMRLYNISAFRDLIFNLIKTHDVSSAAVERVGASPQMGVSSAFSFGQGYGLIHGVLTAFGVQTIAVEASVWKRRAGLGKDKKESIAKVESFFGQRMKDGPAEAVLIAWHVLNEVDVWS